MKKRVCRSLAVKTGTALLLTLLVGTACWVLSLLIRGHGEQWLNITICLTITAALTGIYAYAPISIHLSDHAITLRRGIGQVSINYSDIRRIDLYPVGGVPVRIVGIGGIFGFIGQYYNKNIGRYVSYVGDYGQAFILEMTNSRKYVFSCEDRDEVISAIKHKIVKR